MSRRSDGFPGDFIGERPVSFFIQPAGRPIDTSMIEVLRRPVESSQYTAIRYGNRLAEAGALASIGSIGDSFDNALAESVIGLYKNECIRRDGPIRTVEDLELITSSWVHWFNTSRLHSKIGHIPPVEYEQRYYAAQPAREDPISGEPSLY